MQMKMLGEQIAPTISHATKWRWLVNHSPCSRSELTMLRIISLAFAMILLMAGRVAAQQTQPSISVNGATGGTTVTARASMSVAVANGPGNATDWIGVCNAGCRYHQRSAITQAIAGIT